MKATLAFVLFLVTVFIIEDVKNFYESTQASFFETDIKRNSLIPGTVMFNNPFYFFPVKKSNAVSSYVFQIFENSV